MDVRELQEPTYTLEDVQIITASSTLIESLPKPKTVKLAYQQPMENTPEQQMVIEEILKVFPDAPIMVEVARCESGLYPSADRENRGVDVGLFQINQVHKARLAELGLDRWDLHDNLTYARMLYDSSGLGPWYMSEHCWGRYLA